MGFKQVLVWLLIFVVGSLIVSFIISPQSFENFKENIGSITGKIVESSNPIKEDTSIKSCLSQMNEEFKFTKTMSPTKITMEIKEYQKFNNSTSAYEFSQKWHPNNPYSMLLSGGPEKIEGEQDDIVIVVVRFEYPTQDFGMVKTLVCIDGDLTSHSKHFFRN